MKSNNLSRRDFLQLTALSVGALGLGAPAAAQSGGGATICLVADPTDLAVSPAPATWAIRELTHAIEAHGIHVRQFKTLDQCPPSSFCLMVGSHNTPPVSKILKDANVSVLNAPECLALVPATHNGVPMLLACGSDARGLMYAVLELADRIKYSDNPIQALKTQGPIAEQPFNQVRSVARLFVSDVEDKPWFYNREMWPAYFSMLASQRFNRFHLALGIGYDSLQSVADAYFLFAYPFLLSVPGYGVRAANLPEAERDQNLETLQFISREAVAHGIDFQLGIWTHGYQWGPDSEHANYVIEGLTPANHAAYCRDALAALLKACPHISGVTLRTHGESGVREGSYAFWKTVFAGVTRSGRKVEIDLHTKGLDQTMIDEALATHMPVKLSPKYWAEHMGLPYHQAAIRELEMPRKDVDADDFSALSTGSRIFTRYGYADFLKRDRAYSVMYRVWPGTHRFLLWGDPVSTVAHAQAFRFCGGNGAELFEPLSFKGRRGSGVPGGRCAYADKSLNPHWDWEKYLYTYRVWGRLLYNAHADTDVWQRYLRKQFGGSAPALESALRSATRILPLVTTAHLPSAANDTFNPEFYTNQPMVDANEPQPYGDTPAPKVFENVSPLDPQMFSRISDFVDELLKGERSGKYSPVEVAQWLEGLAQEADRRLGEAGGKSNGQPPINTSPEFRRAVVDLKIHIGLGRFFAAELRSGTLYAIHERWGDRAALEEALKQYRRAREIWSQFAEETKGIYVSDMTFGPLPRMRGNWLDRLPAMDGDIGVMAKRLESLPASQAQTARVRSAIQEALGRPLRGSVACFHTPSPRFLPGKDLEIVLAIKQPTKPISVRLHYRHVNQAERYDVAEIPGRHGEYRTVIPASYTASKYSIQYYFELREGTGKAWLYPGFDADLTNQPYFVVPKTM
ncbi:MAG: twin-arginine translocation signal domain-containing protein [Terriglobales bacterium]